MFQAADHVEALFNDRLPPSMRIERYKPVKSHPHIDNGKIASPNEKTPAHKMASQAEETLGDQQQDAQVEARAEVREELALTLVDSQISRRGSDATAYSGRDTRLPPPKAQLESHGSATPGWRIWQRKPTEPKEDKGVTEDGIYYDMSYIRALFIANRSQWAICIIILACSSELFIMDTITACCSLQTP